MPRLKMAGEIFAALLLMTGTRRAEAVVINVNALLHCDFPNNPLTVPLAQGTYSATLIQGTYSAWRYASPSVGGTWNTLYYIRVVGGTEYTGGDWLAAGTALDAFNQTVVKTLVFTQPANGDIKLLVADNKCTDNSGGVSLEIILLPVPAATSTWGKVKALYR